MGREPHPVPVPGPAPPTGAAVVAFAVSGVALKWLDDLMTGKAFN